MFLKSKSPGSNIFRSFKIHLPLPAKNSSCGRMHVLRYYLRRSVQSRCKRNMIASCPAQSDPRNGTMLVYLRSWEKAATGTPETAAFRNLQGITCTQHRAALPHAICQRNRVSQRINEFCHLELTYKMEICERNRPAQYRKKGSGDRPRPSQAPQQLAS